MTSSKWSRRDLLRFGGLGIGASAVLGAAGCGGEGASSDERALEFMYWGSTFEQKAIDAMLEQFEQRGDGLSVKPLYTPEEYDTKLNTLIASERAPDVAYIGSAMAYRLAAQDKLVNLFPYFDKYPELANRLPATYFWYGQDKTFGNQTANEVMLLWYNKQTFDEVGMDYPPAEASNSWTWDQWVENAYKLTIDQNGKHPDESGFDPKQIKQFGLSCSIEYTPAWYGFLRSRGIDFVDEAGTKCLLDTPEAIEVFQNLQDLIYKHHVAPTPGQLGGSDAPATNIQLQTKRIAMVVDGQWILLDMAQSDLEYGIGVLPRYDEPVSTSLGGASVIFKSSRHDEEALELYLFHNDPEHVDLYKDGLWMPLERKYYTDPESVAKWVDNDVHPPEFQTAVVDYTLDHAVPAFGQKLKNMENIDEVLTPALQEIQTGKRTAKEVLTNLTPKIDERLQGWNPTQAL